MAHPTPSPLFRMAMAASSGRAKRRKNPYLTSPSLQSWQKENNPASYLNLTGTPTPRRRSRASRAVCVATQVCYFLIHAL
jgi:hypothetical protein